MDSTPTAADLAAARVMAERIVAAGEGAVELVILFGSRARGTAHPRSDFDLLVVERERRATYPEEERLTDALQELGIWADVRVVSLSSFDATRSRPGYLSHAASVGGVTLFRREANERLRSAVA